MIADDSGKPTSYSEAIKDTLLKGSFHSITQADIVTYLNSRYDKILDWWKSAHLGTSLGTDINNWANHPTSKRYTDAGSPPPDYKIFLLNSIAENALGYLELVYKWRLFTTNIQMLSIAKNKPLYKDPKNIEADLYDCFQNLCDPLERQIAYEYFYGSARDSSYTVAINGIAQKMKLNTDTIKNILEEVIFSKIIKCLNSKGYPMNMEIPGKRKKGE